VKTLKKRASVIAIALALVMVISAVNVFAATGSYSGYTYKTKDLYSPTALTKTGTGQACFNVTQYGDDSTSPGSCSFWLEFENGLNITKKVTVSKKVGKTTLTYEGTPSHYKGTKSFLCISTSLTTLSRQYVKGKWSPDNVTL